MKLGQIATVAALELRSLVKGPLFWALIVVAVLGSLSIGPAALIPKGDPATGALLPEFNSSYGVAQLFALCGFMIYSFFAAIMAGMAIIRDDEAGVAELLHSTPLRAGEYVVGKLVGVIAALLAALALHLLATALIYELRPLIGSAAQRGPFHLGNYVWPALALAGPGIGLSAGLAFAVGERSRRPLLVYVVPTALFMATVFIFLPWRAAGLGPLASRVLMIFDPSGMRWLIETFFRIDRGAEFYNTAPLGFDVTYWLRLLFMLGLPTLAVAASVRHCRQVALGTAGAEGLLARWRSRSRTVERPAENHTAGAKQATFEPLRELQMSASPPSFWAGTFAVLRAELLELRSQPALYVFTGLFLVMIPEAVLNRRGVYDAHILATAGGIATSTLTLVTWLACLLLLFYTVETLQRERLSGFESISYAAPVSTAAMLLAKGLTLAVVATIALGAAGVLCLALLAVQPGAEFEVWPFLLVWGAVLPATCFFWSTFIGAVFSLVRHRYVTYVVGLGALAVTAAYSQRGALTWVTNWPLWGALRWSDMGTFALNGRALLLNRGLVVALGCLFAAVAVQHFARAERDATGWRSRLETRSLLVGGLRLVPFALLPILLAGYLATEVAAGFQGEVAQQRAKSYWRRNVATWTDVETAEVRHVDLRVDLEPSRRGAAIDGTFTMVNPTDRPLARLPFTVLPAFGDVEWTLDGRLVEAEDRNDLHLLRPAVPLAPGEQILVGFSYQGVFPRGMTRNGRGVEQFVLPSGVALHTLRNSFLPTPGFVASRGLDEGNRYAPPDYPEDYWQQPRPAAVGSGSPFTARIEVSAPSAYTVNSVGRKTAERRRDGRTTVVWESDYPVGLINLVAGRWRERRVGQTAVFYHPTHEAGAERILATLVEARERFSEWFFPYPWQDLRLSEFPDLVTNAQGFPTNIPFSESIGFVERPSTEGKPFSFVTAHEAAHQWWGNIVAAAEGPGTGHLIEGMAHFSALLLQESLNGEQGRIDLCRLMEQSYSYKRNSASELPVAKMLAGEEPADWTVVYEKGAWVMWMLDDLLGREQTLAGLQEFVRTYHHNPRHPSTEDLLAVLRRHAADPMAFDAFVEQWFYSVVLPAFRFSEVTKEQVGDSWRVSASVENIGTGTVEVELAVARGERFTDDESTYLDRRIVQILTPGQTRQVSWEVDFEPQRLVADPDFLLLQRQRDRARVEL